jgi:hypothetical protein
MLNLRIDVYHHFPSSPGGHQEVLAAVHQLHEDVKKMNDATDRLTREVAETRQAVTDLTGRYQSKIDELQTHVDALQAAIDAEDPAAIQAAADNLDALQTEMAALAAPPTPPVGGDTQTGNDTGSAGGGTDTTGSGGGTDSVNSGAGNDAVQQVADGAQEA